MCVKVVFEGNLKFKWNIAQGSDSLHSLSDRRRHRGPADMNNGLCILGCCQPCPGISLENNSRLGIVLSREPSNNGFARKCCREKRERKCAQVGLFQGFPGQCR